MVKRVIDVKVLPGEPLDGGGRVCIHLFIQDERGLFTEPSVTYMADNEHGQKQLSVRPMRGRLACDPRRKVAPVTRGNVTTVTPRTDDPRAVTCLRCCRSAEYTEMMSIIAAAEAGK